MSGGEIGVVIEHFLPNALIKFDAYEGYVHLWIPEGESTPSLTPQEARRIAGILSMLADEAER